MSALQSACIDREHFCGHICSLTRTTSPSVSWSRGENLKRMWLSGKGIQVWHRLGTSYTSIVLLNLCYLYVELFGQMLSALLQF